MTDLGTKLIIPILTNLLLIVISFIFIRKNKAKVENSVMIVHNLILLIQNLIILYYMETSHFHEVANFYWLNLIWIIDFPISLLQLLGFVCFPIWGLFLSGIPGSVLWFYYGKLIKTLVVKLRSSNESS